MRHPDDVKAVILSLKNNTSSGYDNMPAHLLIKCVDIISVPLAKIFNMSIEQGQYPDLLKRNNIIPIYKRKGDKDNIDCYRGISIQPVLAKVFEKLVNNQLRNHTKHLISDSQHGFVPNRSCFSNLACYSDYITKHIDDKCEVHSIYTDFSKAFDVVPHNLLIHKMQSRFGISDNILLWFSSYLTNRYQRVILYGENSEWVHVTSGVPQGSILGPHLFLMYIDDLPDECEYSESLLFADDDKIFRIIHCIADCLRLQSDLNRLYEWCSTWKIYLNLDKCNFISFSNKRNKVDFVYRFGDHVIEKVDTIKDLGIYFSSNMIFRFHIEKTVSSSLRMLGFVYRTCKAFDDVDVLISLYKSLVRTKLEYCCSIWSPTQEYLIKKVERVQKRLVRWAAFKKGWDYETSGYLALCESFKLQTLESRRTRTDLVNLNKIITAKINCTYLLSQIVFYVPVPQSRRRPSRSRRRDRLFSDDGRINIRKRSYFPRVLSFANNLNDIDFYEQNLLKFKTALFSIAL